MASFDCIIPCYNLGRYLEQAIISALDQTRAFDHIFIIDDGSEDNTPDILAKKWPERVVSMRTTNQGYSRTRNLGMSLSDADYICYLDADDWLYSNYASEVAGMFSTSREIGVVCPQVEAEGVTVAGGIWPAPHDDDLAQLRARNYVWVSSGIRRQAAVDVGGFIPDLEPASDWGFWVAIRMKGWRIVGIHKPLWHWRDRPDGLHMGINDNVIRGKMEALFPS